MSLDGSRVAVAQVGAHVGEPVANLALADAGYHRARLAVAELSNAVVDASGGPDHYLRTRRPELYGAR